MFVRAKRLKRGHKVYISYAVVHNYREGGKVKQRTIYTLGSKYSTIRQAIEARRQRERYLNGLRYEVDYGSFAWLRALKKLEKVQSDITLLEELERRIERDKHKKPR